MTGGTGTRPVAVRLLVALGLALCVTVAAVIAVNMNAQEPATPPISIPEDPLVIAKREADAIFERGAAAFYESDYETTKQIMAEAVQRYEELGDVQGLAMANELIDYSNLAPPVTPGTYDHDCGEDVCD